MPIAETKRVASGFQDLGKISLKDFFAIVFLREGSMEAIYTAADGMVAIGWVEHVSFSRQTVHHFVSHDNEDDDIKGEGEVLE